MRVGEDRPIHIVYLGENGFPFGMASIQRQLLIAKGLIQAGAKVLVISNKGTFSRDKGNIPNRQGIYQGVPYIYTSGKVYREASFFKRNYLKIKGQLAETLLLFQRRRKRQLDFAIVATMRFQHIFWYFLISRILGFKILLNYVEHNSSIKTRSKWRDRMNDKLIDYWAFSCADAILPISTFLAARVKEGAPGKPYLKIPILSDTTEPWPTKNNLPIPSFLYCGSGTYLELIRFILDSFTLVANTATFLDLVVSGDAKEMEAFDELIANHPLKDQIRTYSDISYAQLCQLYVDATALLIPLRPSIQDQARFPHKIGEYLASGNPVITTNYGEIPFYFEDLETALVAKEYSPTSFAEKMIYVLAHPEQATQIGLQGKKFAGVEFAYEKHGLALLSFIKTMR